MTDQTDSYRDRKRPIIGSFVLETLTLGMYGEPRHTLREYVQNSFDAIRAAERTKLLSVRGQVEIIVRAESLTIRDNGVGVPSEQAWTTLTSVGASKKDRQRDAGFRGIGRLAGMAYCDELIFRTTFAGETVLTTVRFDCKKLLAAMNPDAGGDIELAKLLDESIHFDQRETNEEPKHFFEVTLSGLDRAPQILTDAAEIRDYLAETAPVDFAPEWEHRERIASEYKSYFGEAIETIDILVTTDGETRPVFKHYGQVYELAKATAQLERIEFYQDEDGLYWGWVGYLSESGAVTDRRTRGLRVRTRNIQIDGTEILEKLFAQVNPSYGRLSSFYVGEIHINPTSVVPNARRDGFEETHNWISIQENIRKNVCGQLASEAYLASRNKQVDVRKVISDIDELGERARTLSVSSRSTYDQVVELMTSARRLRRKAASALKLVGDLDDTSIDIGEPRQDLAGAELLEAKKHIEDVEQQARMLIGRSLSDDERVEALRLRLRQEIINEVLDIVNLFVDPLTYQKIKRRLIKPTAPNP